MDALGDDELTEIFRKLPTKTVHTLKCVCKYWSSLISSPKFVFSYLQLHPSCKRTYLILHITRDLDGKFIPLWPLDESYSTADRADESSSFGLDLPERTPLSLDFLPLHRTPEKRLQSLTLAATCEGLWLFKADFTVTKDIDFLSLSKDTNLSLSNDLVFYICNPITRQWSELPSTSSRTNDIAGFTCQTSVDSSNGYQIVEFTVVILDTVVNLWWHGVDTLHVQVFSTKVGSWKTYNVAVPRLVGFQQCKSIRGKPEVVINGIFHWDGIHCIITYDPLNNPYRFEAIKLPENNYHDDVFLTKCISKIAKSSEGKLRLLQSYNNYAFYLWELVDYDNRTWTLLYEVEDVANVLCGFQIAGFYGDKVCLVNDRVRLLNVPDPHWETDTVALLLDMKDASVTQLYEEQPWEFKDVMPYETDSWPTPVPQLQR